MNAQEKREALTLLLEKFAESYAQKKGAVTLNEWLASELKEHLPEKTREELNTISSEILSGLAVQEEKKVSLEKFTEQGRSKESWFASELKKDTASMSQSERDEVLRSIDGAVSKNQADVVNRINKENAEPLTPEVMPPVTNDYQADEAAKTIGKKIADKATINIVISSDVIEAVSKNMKVKTPEHSAIIEQELLSGNTMGLKTAAAGAIYTGAEMGYVK